MCWRSRLESSNSSTADEVHQMVGAVSQRLEDFPGATPLQKFEDVGTGLPSETCECHQLGVADAKSQSENRSPSGNGLGFLGHRLECFVTKWRKHEFRFAHIVPVFGSFPAFRIHFLSRSNKSLMKGKKEFAEGRGRVCQSFSPSREQFCLGAQGLRPSVLFQSTHPGPGWRKPQERDIN